jgi:hypothetical protein
MEYMKIQEDEEFTCNATHLNFLGIFNFHWTDQQYDACAPDLDFISKYFKTP